jgi:hypothetical protein
MLLRLRFTAGAAGFFLQPVGRQPGPIARPEVLAHDALEAALAGVSEDKLPVIVLQVLIQP